MQAKPSIVFCHRIRADRSGFSKVIPPLRPEEHEVIAALFITCRQGAVIRTKCDPAAPCDCLRFAPDRVLSVSRSEA